MRAIATDPCWLVRNLGSGCRRVFGSLKEVCKQRRREGAITQRVATGYGSACLNQRIGGLAQSCWVTKYPSGPWPSTWSGTANLRPRTGGPSWATTFLTWSPIDFLVVPTITCVGS